MNYVVNSLITDIDNPSGRVYSMKLPYSRPLKFSVSLVPVQLHIAKGRYFNDYTKTGNDF